MDIIKFLEDAVNVCSRIIKFGAGIQSQARNELINDLQKICSNVETAYSNVLAQLRPIKDSYQDSAALAKALRTFAADQETRDSFKPDHLCSEVDRLLSKLENNLDPLKYSVDVSKIRALKQNIRFIGNVDAAIYQAYDEFARDLDNLSTELQLQPPDTSIERREYARHVIADFEDDLFSAVTTMREAKDRILR